MAQDRSRECVRWLARIEPPALVVLACPEADVPALGAGVAVVRLAECVRDAPLGLVAQILAVGAARVSVVACPLQAAGVRERVAQWARVLDGVGMQTEPFPRRRWDRAERFDAGQGPSRRALLGLGTPSGPLDLSLEETARSVAALRLWPRQGRARQAPPEEAASEPPQVPDAPGAPDAPDAPDASGAVELVAAGCIACGVCVRACGPGALTLVEEPGASVLRHDAEACRGERRCVELCPVAALSVVGELDVVALAGAVPVDLARVATVACPRCRARHPGAAGELCPACTFRVRNPFGSIDPRQAGSVVSPQVR